MISKKITITITSIAIFDIAVCIFIKNYTLAFVVAGLSLIAWIELTMYFKLFHFMFTKYRQRVK